MVAGDGFGFIFFVLIPDVEGPWGRSVLYVLEEYALE